jgi:methylenetetrahydrofolate--tRNA-(uracil-5-)-methyltransferase
MTQKTDLTVIGGGLAGCEAAWQAAEQGCSVRLYEMRPTRSTDAHITHNLAELVCSNSFRSDDATQNAVGVLHAELRRCNSVIMQSADTHQVPAGGALAVDRHGFSAAVEAAINNHPRITVIREEITSLKPFLDTPTIVATGPLTSDALAQDILALTGEEALAFFDAIAPIVTKESINFEIAWFQSRYDKTGPGGSGKDYINCPLTKDEYYGLIDALLAGESHEFKEWEKNTPYFDACLPIEVMAARGPETLRFGPMKPVGLTDPRTGESPYAVAQLRQDNAAGTLYNMVGFQTKLRYGTQSDILRLIPGLEAADFVRLGGIHRNTFMNSPRLLDRQLTLKTHPQLRFAGQVIGVEGYVESTAMGLLAGRFAAAQCLGKDIIYPHEATAMGALLNHVTGAANPETFQPMNVNFGLFPPLEGRIKKKERKLNHAKRAAEAFNL